MLIIGSILHGNYRIDRYLSSGGFGNTYVVTNVEFDECYAVKEFFMKGITQREEDHTTVSVSNTENTPVFNEQKNKFKKEARRLRQLRSSHIVSVHDLFEENGTVYYVMDYVDGENLGERLKRTGQPLTEAEVQALLPQILDALHVTHQANIWHLDLKPGNIMVDKTGCVKLIDFGASKQLSGTNGSTTVPTAMCYTQGYAPLEQMEQNYDKLGPWTDLYALGATIYNLLTNRIPPRPTDIDDDLTEYHQEALPMPANISERMRDLILWLMQPSRMRRPHSIDEVIKYLNAHEVEDKKPAESVEDSEKTVVADPSKTVAVNRSEETAVVNDPSKTVAVGQAQDEATRVVTPSAPSADDDEPVIRNGKRVIDYLKQPFSKAVITILASATSLCGGILLLPDFFFLFGEYDGNVGRMVLGSVAFSDIPFDLLHYLNIGYILIYIGLLIPIIIGLYKMDKGISYLLGTIAVIIFLTIIYYQIVDFDSFFSQALICARIFFFIIVGFLISSRYEGRIKTLGSIMVLYGFIQCICTILFKIEGIRAGSGMNLLDVFGWIGNFLFIWTIWWFLVKTKPANAIK